MTRSGTIPAVAMVAALVAAPGQSAESVIRLEDQTLPVTAGLGVYHAEGQLLELHFFPVALTPAQVAKAVAEGPGALSFELESPEPGRWEYCPMATINVQPIGPDLQLDGRPQNMTITTLHLKGGFYNTATGLSGSAIPEDWGSLEVRGAGGERRARVRIRLAHDDLSVDLDQEVVIYSAAE